MTNKERRALEQSIKTLRSKAAREPSLACRIWYTRRADEAASKLGV
jgi:hypothetical protein